MKQKRRRLVRIEVLPTLLTLGNLLCGFGALIFITKGNFLSAAWLILMALGIFDALDGKVARLTRGASRFGRQLDSLADVISFGVAPAFLTYQMINLSPRHIIPLKFTFLLCAFYLVCVALRLARFNIETTEDVEAHQYFSGLPSPGAAGMIATLIILHYEFQKEIQHVFIVFLPSLIFGLALLMVSQCRYVHVLNRIIQTKHPFIRIVEIILATVLIAFHPEIGLCLGFGIYVLSGPVSYLKSILFPPVKIASGGKEPSFVGDEHKKS